MKVAQLNIVDAPRKWITPIDFQVTWSKVSVKAGLCTDVFRTIFFVSCQTWYSGCPLRKDISMDFQVVMKSHGQRADLHPKCCLLIILWSNRWLFPNFATPVELSLLLFGPRSKSNYWSSFQDLPLNILWIICLIINKLGTVDDWLYTGFCTRGGGIYVSQTFLVSIPSHNCINCNLSEPSGKTSDYLMHKSVYIAGSFQ